jgi:hypothetical protein
MRNLQELTAEKILAINLPEALFSQSSNEAKLEYRFLARRWHPDCDPAPNAVKVFAHIAELYRAARVKSASGQWNEPAEKIENQVAGTRTFKLDGGDTKTFQFRTIRPFELGAMYVADNFVLFEINREYVDIFDNGRKRMHTLHFKNDAMALAMSKYLPQIQETFKTAQNNIVRIRKTPDQLLLSDVIKHFGGQLKPIEHVGWVINNLLNLACYLEWSGIAHNAIAPETVFISPLRHSAMLLGGWWYAAKLGRRLTAVPDRSLNYIPPDVLRNKIADVRTDLELIKSVGREILGDATGASLAYEKDLPPDLVEWLLLPSTGRAAEDYRTFKREVLPNAFGSPKFVNMQLDADLLYKEN